jgi:hypothetical protein
MKSIDIEKVLIDIAAKVVPRIPSLKDGISKKNRKIDEYPFEEFFRVHCEDQKP